MRDKHSTGYRWFLPHIRKGRVLDVGCGNQPLRALLPAETQYISLDYPATARFRYSGRPSVFGDGQRLPFADETFDTVALLDVLEHIPRPDLAFAEAVRVTKPGGTILYQTPFLYPLHDLPYDFQRWSAYGIRQFATRNPVTLEHLETNGHAIHTAVLLSNLALSRLILDAFEKRQPGFLLLPVAAIWIVLSNLLGWLFGRILEDSEFMTLGYRVIFKKNF